MQLPTAIMFYDKNDESGDELYRQYGYVIPVVGSIVLIRREGKRTDWRVVEVQYYYEVSEVRNIEKQSQVYVLMEAIK